MTHNLFTPNKTYAGHDGVVLYFIRSINEHEGIVLYLGPMAFGYTVLPIYVGTIINVNTLDKFIETTSFNDVLICSVPHRLELIP